jgi:hypothetical protein
VNSILHREHAAIGCYQEVRREAEFAAVRAELWSGVASGCNLGEVSAQPASDRPPRARVEQGARRGLDTEGPIEIPIGVGDYVNGQIGGVGTQLIHRRVKDDDLVEARGLDLRLAGEDRTKMEIAYGASREAAKLKVHQPCVGRKAGDRAVDRLDLAVSDLVSDADPSARTGAGPGRSLITHHVMILFASVDRNDGYPTNPATRGKLGPSGRSG